MKSYAVITSLLFAAAAAAPIVDASASNTIERRAPVVIRPTALHTYSGSTGAIHTSSEGHIMRSASQSDQSTLVTFNIPDIYRGKTCAFRVNLNSPNDFASGSRQFDVFTSIKPATADTESWPPGNLRDQYIGRMKFNTQVTPGFADWVSDIAHPGSSFPCPTGIMAGELVPVGDQVDIYWSSQSAGPRIVVLNP